MKPFITSLLVYPLLAVALASAQAQAPAKPNDAQIAQIVNVADTIDIKAGQLALSKSTNAQVKAFAQDMVRDHTQVNEQALALVKKLNVQPQDSDTSRALTRQADEQVEHLQGLNGAAFDRAYAENELAYHREVNDADHEHAHSVGQQPRTQEPAATRAQDLRGPPATCRATGQGVR